MRYRVLVKPSSLTGRVEMHLLPSYLCRPLLVDVRQLSVLPVPVAFQIEPVLSFVVRVRALLEPPVEKKIIREETK